MLCFAFPVLHLKGQINLLHDILKKLGSLARTCNVATDRLFYQDVRGLSAAEPCPKARIWDRIKLKDTGTPREPGLVNRPGLVCLGDQTGPT